MCPHHAISFSSLIPADSSEGLRPEVGDLTAILIWEGVGEVGYSERTAEKVSLRDSIGCGKYLWCG